jgi:peptidoglycan-associated lipoprotein
LEFTMNRSILSCRLSCLACAVALFLSACASNVKLDEPRADGGAGGVVSVPGGNAGAADAARGESAVAPVSATSPVKALGLVDLPKAIYFDYDSFVVKPEFMSTVEGYAKALQATSGVRMSVEGHTDERGGREYNLALGQKRAEAVLRSLAVLGAKDAQLEAISMGEEKPAAEGADEAAWSKNRRAEFKVR